MCTIDQTLTRIGGSARGYQELFRTSAFPATAKQAYGYAEFLCSVALGVNVDRLRIRDRHKAQAGGRALAGPGDDLALTSAQALRARVPASETRPVRGGRERQRRCDGAGQACCPYARTAAVIDQIHAAASATGEPDDEMAAPGQRNRLDIQLVHHLSRDFPVASHDENAPFQSAASTARNRYPAQAGRPADSGVPGFGNSSAGLPHSHDDRANTRQAR